MWVPVSGVVIVIFFIVLLLLPQLLFVSQYSNQVFELWIQESIQNGMFLAYAKDNFRWTEFFVQTMLSTHHQICSVLIASYVILLNSLSWVGFLEVWN